MVRRTNKMEMSDINVGESVLTNANNVGKAGWWAVNALGSFSKVLAVTVANSEVKAIRVIDDGSWADVAMHGSNSGFKVIESVSSIFKSTTEAKPKSPGYGSFKA